jgi:hypothetical protein
MKITITMKVDFLSCTKMLYLAEWLAQGSYYLLPEPDDLARQTGITEQEIRKMCDQFEHEGIFRWEDISVESENNYGELKSEISYDGLGVDMKKLIDYIDDTKKRFGLRKEPTVTREAIASIAEQFQAFFGKDKLIKIINSFSGDRDMSSRCFDNGQYSLTDILFRHSYADSSIEPLSMVLAEFLNPMYYNIGNNDDAVKIFDYIDRVLSMAKDRHDYEEWLKAAEKYNKKPKNDSKALEDGAVSKMKFDSQNGVLRYGDVTHAFHKGQRGEEIRILFFRHLWDEKRLIKKGVEKISGTLRAPAYFAVQLDLVSDVSTFARDKKAKDRLSGFIKGINKILKQKGFPALIERKGGVQLVVNEK